MPRWFLLFILVLFIGIFGWVIYARYQYYKAPIQPLNYSHRTHVQAGIGCIFCHPSAQRSPVAGVPSLQKCMGCHQFIVSDDPAVQELQDFWKRGEPISWLRVNNQPDFVYFSHQPHLGVGLNCENCHGNVGQMDKTRPAFIMDMGWCLNCHLDQSEEKVGRLTDCIACHK